MTGASSFTRRAGFVGLLSVALALLSVPLLSYLRRRSWARPSFDDTRGVEETLAYVLFGVILLCGVVMFAGLVVRHWHHFLPRLALKIGAVGIVAGLVFESVEVAKVGIGVTALLVLVAVLAVGELPRAPVILLLVAEVLNLGEIEWAALLVLVGWTWLAWAMWREPRDSPGERTSEANLVAAS